MKKILFCLAATALLATGCGGNNPNKISKAKFNEEMTEYGFVFENNARFEGHTSLGIPVDVVLEIDSIGNTNKVKVSQHAEGEGDMITFANVVKGEDDNCTLEIWIKKYGQTTFGYSKNENMSWQEVKGSMLEFIYLPAFNYKDFSFNSSKKAYECESYNAIVTSGGETMAVEYTNILLEFEEQRLNKVDCNLSVSGMSAEFNLEKKEAGNVTVTLPEIPA